MPNSPIWARCKNAMKYESKAPSDNIKKESYENGKENYKTLKNSKVGYPVSICHT